eukprot:CAMPEP_0115547950 /NCGR_PEP_ID=MMETSP0271-20121206/93915_1 /TAXON_ID=71861 /ORGANISM="Scrippsiella trochoidea, Strain CCMP3099" /LENGTH=129 /DNA_ID=CAMNT_0002981407 /DNA_START=790 /DNA_END=1180 /DNA_ORIENTATION=-
MSEAHQPYAAFLALTSATNCETLSFVPIASNIAITASFAPPCAGPQREATPAAIQAYGFACELPAMRTVEVEAFCSWSMWRIMNALIALAATGLTTYSSIGVANIMYKKFSAKLRLAFGYMMGCPMDVL